jgi:hypothetical protein
MKKVYLLSCLIFAACASTETTPTSADGSLPQASESGLSSDPFLDISEQPVEAREVADSTESSLATPVDSSDTGSAESTLAQPTPPGPPPPPPPTPTVSPAPTEAAPTAAQNVPPPVVQSASASQDERTLYQEYLEYQDQRKNRDRVDESLESRSLFAHEDGAWQLGLDYGHEAFQGFDFDPTANSRVLADTKGGTLSVTHFPVRSLSYGRLGLGLQASVYWSKFEFFRTDGTPDTTQKHVMDTIGGKAIYEFQYFVGQILVPFALYGYDSVRVRSFQLPVVGGSYPKQTINSQNYGGGVHLNLNRLERRAASRALATSGIRKFYLSYTYQKREMNEVADHFLGLRFEY